MGSRISWIGIGVGALVGGLLRVTVMALHFPDIIGDQYPIAILPAVVGMFIGGAASATGRALLGAVVGAGLSFLFYLGSLVLTGVAAFLGAGTLPGLWEMLAVGAIPGAIGGAVGQFGSKRRNGAVVVRNF
jgi:hypothetical protein